MKKISSLLVLLLAAGGIVFIGLTSFRQAASPLPSSPTSTSQPQQAAAPVATTSAATPVPFEEIVQLAWFYKPPDEGQLDPVAQNFDVFILTYKDEPARDAFKSAGVEARFAQYLLALIIEDPGDCEEDPHGNQVAYKEGDFCQISELHPDWFLLDQNGQRIQSGSDTFHMDPGSEGYRQFFLERARELQEANGWDDLFLDNVEASLAKMTGDDRSVMQYPDDKSYQQAVAGFLQYLRQNYFEPRGKRIYGNIVSRREEDNVWDFYLQHMDGAMIESFATEWSDGYRDRDDWQEQIARVENSLAQGKTMILVAQGEQDDLDMQNFAYASYLLVANGNASFRYTHSENYREVWLYENYNYDLGAPIGPRYEEDGGWRRDFAKGYVWVHPGDHEAEIVVN